MHAYARSSYANFQLSTALLCVQNGGYASGGNCLTVAVQSVDYDGALRVCSDLHGKLADIQNEKEQTDIESFARTKVSESAIYFWLDMTYQPSVSNTGIMTAFSPCSRRRLLSLQGFKDGIS